MPGSPTTIAPTIPPYMYEARASIDALAQKYWGRDYDNEIQSERVILRIAADRQIVH